MHHRWVWLALLAGCGPIDEVCGNRLDDDGDGLVDCADPACFSESCVEICDDNEDNNLDQLLDCADPQCDGRGCAEVCDDGRDNDRNGAVDCADAACAETCDADGDGHATTAGGGDDCDDADPEVHPGAVEHCNGVDDNCNGLVDRDDPDIARNELFLWHLDADGDGYGDPENAVYECTAPAGRVDNALDCDDTDPDTNPDTPEVCNGLDDNCDGLVDDQDPLVDLTGAATWYVDMDGDGLGSASYSLVACNRPAGYADNTDDCDDGNNLVLGPSMWLLDGDGDGFGAGGAVGPYGCTPPSPNHVPDYTRTDCDDADAQTFPGAYEFCGDGLDRDCDGSDCAQWIEDFESGGLSGVWTTGGAAQWLVQAAVVHDGAFAAENGNIGNNQQSWLMVDVDFPAGGEVSFWHAGDTESGFDFLEVRIDGTLVLTRSGLWAWTWANFPVGPGLHNVEFRYRKDGTVSVGADSVWIDDVLMPGGQP